MIYRRHGPGSISIWFCHQSICGPKGTLLVHAPAPDGAYFGTTFAPAGDPCTALSAGRPPKTVVRIFLGINPG